MHRRSLLLSALALPLLGACDAGGDGAAPPAVAPTTPRAGADASGHTGPVNPQRVAYGDDPSQFGDLYRPEGAAKGVVVVVHGGFWRAQYGLGYGAPLAASLAERGWAAWNIEYRRVGPADAGGGGGVPATLDDVTAAIEHLETFDLPTDVVVGLGHSAGGHLAVWAGGGGRLTHVISQAGVLDLVAAEAENLGGGAVQEFVGGHALAPLDPLQLVPLDVPVWCVHATHDDIVPFSQSTAYVTAAQAAGARAELVEVDGDHFTVVDPTSAAWARTLEILDSLG